MSWTPTLELLFAHGSVRSDGERLAIELLDAAFRYEVLEVLGKEAPLLGQLDVLSGRATARWLDLDAACKAWQRGRLGAGELGLAAAMEVAARAVVSGGGPVESPAPAGFEPVLRLDLQDGNGRRIAEVFSDGAIGFWRALDPDPALVKLLVVHFARPQERLAGGMQGADGMMVDGLETLAPWKVGTLKAGVAGARAARGPVATGSLIRLGEGA